jgi:hypothetical protein
MEQNRKSRVLGLAAMLICLASSAAQAMAASKDAAETSKVNEGYYVNPIFAGDYPDPSIFVFRVLSGVINLAIERFD